MLEHKYHYVYRIEHNETGDFYIGLRSCDCLPDIDSYFGSGVRVSNAIKKHGKKSFTKTILSVFPSRAEASKFEASIVSPELLENKFCMNLKTGGEYEFGTTYANDVCQKMRLSSQNRFKDPAAREKISKAVKSRFNENPEIAKRISTSLKKHFDENPTARDEISKRAKARWQNPEFVSKVKSILAELWAKEPERKSDFRRRMSSQEACIAKSRSLKNYANSEQGQIALSKATKDSTYMNKNDVTKRVQKCDIQEHLRQGWNFGSLLDVSNETRQKLGTVTRGRKWMYIIEPFQRARIKQEDIQSYLDQGWKLGQKPSIQTDQEACCASTRL